LNLKVKGVVDGVNGKLWRILLVLSLIFSTVAVAFVVTDPSLPVVSVGPLKSTGGVGETFTIDVTIADITQEESLYGFDVKILFDPNILECTKVLEGPFLSDTGYSTSWSMNYTFPKIDNTAGSVYAPNILWTYQGGAFGNGVLCHITFQVKAVGRTTLHFSKIQLNTFDGTDVFPIDHTAVDGVFTNVHDVAVVDVEPSITSVLLGDSVNIDVTVANEGDFNETFDVTTYWKIGASYDIIKTREDVSLQNGTSTTLPFMWTPHTPGTYTIVANVSVVEHEIDIADNTFFNGEVKVTSPTGPEALFTYSPPAPMARETVTFNATDSYDRSAGGYIVSYKWDFNDGNITTANYPIITHAYTTHGEYYVVLTVTDNDGEKDISARLITIRDYPEALFTYSPGFPLKNRLVTFDASGSTPDGGKLVDPDSYFWDFGDGANGTGKIVKHSYDTPGTYTVNLTVTDSEGLANFFAEDLEVSILHDVAVEKVEIFYLPEQDLAYPYSVYAGKGLNVTVDVLNNGTETESFNVTAYYDSTPIGTLRVDDLAPEDTKHVGVAWFTTEVPAGNYNVTAEAILEADNSTGNNMRTTTIEVKVADVAITNVTVSSNVVLAGELLNVSVMVRNEGSGIVPQCTVTIEFINATGSVVSSLSERVLSVEPEAEKKAEWTNLNATNPVLNVRVLPGTYILSAEVVHPDEPEPFKGDNVFVYGNITIGASLVSISASAETIALGSKVTLNGSITPVRPNVNVTIQCRVGEEEAWSTVEIVETDENGTYLYRWKPKTTGTYEVRAGWEGDDNTLGGVSETLVITVNAALPNVFLYVLAVAAVIVMAATALYLLRFRKPKLAQGR